MNISQKFFHVGDLPDRQFQCILYFIPLSKIDFEL